MDLEKCISKLERSLFEYKQVEAEIVKVEFNERFVCCQSCYSLMAKSEIVRLAYRRSYVAWKNLHSGDQVTDSATARSSYAFRECKLACLIYREMDANDVICILHALDRAFITTNGALWTREIQDCINACMTLIPMKENTNIFNTNRIEPPLLSLNQEAVPEYQLKFPIDRINLSLPCHLKQWCSHWPACQQWLHVPYWLKHLGPRLVPVEMGSSYTGNDDEWTVRWMPFVNYLNEFIFTSSDTIGYLAQHDLLSQAPSLEYDLDDVDVVIDDALRTESLKGSTVINIWLGPSGTHSPLHYDPFHNILCQIVGHKRIILFAPDASVYPFKEKMKNTSQIDLLNVDLNRFPLMATEKAFICDLAPGDALFIPRGWWHDVRSLSDSISASHWF